MASSRAGGARRCLTRSCSRQAGVGQRSAQASPSLGPATGRVAGLKPAADAQVAGRQVAFTMRRTRGVAMTVTVIWDTVLKPGAEADGLRLTRQVWSDMRAFEGYQSHEIFIDQDAPGHIIALAHWRSREDADRVKERYKDSETIRQLTPLLARPRERWITAQD